MNRLARLFLLCSMLFLSGVLLLGRQSAAPALAETSAAPDLIIESITVSPPNPGPGSTGDITIRVKNIGDGPTSGQMRVYLYIDPAEAPPTQNTPYLQRWGYGLTLLPGGTFEVSRTGHPFTGTNPKIYAWIDPPWENGVVESNEANNFYPPLGDAYEDDNECGKANAITTDGVAQLHDLRPDPATDVDWVLFTGNSGKRYRVEAVAAGDAELELELHDTCNDPPTFGVGAVITFTAPETGDYYVKVNHSGAAAVTNSNYDLKVTQLTSASCTSADEFNDICSTAGEMPINSRQEQIFCKPNDVDWTRFPVDAGGVYQINILNGPNTNVEANLHQSCNLPASTDIGQSFVVTPATGGFLYLETRNSDPNGVNGLYTVEINRLKEGCGADPFEVDNNADSAKVITVDGPAQNRNICPPGDQDWVKFSAVAGVTYTLETLNSGLTGDTVLCLRTPDGAYTQCDDDAGPGKGSRLLFTPTASGDYFVSVTDHDPAVAGPDTAYALRVRTRLCDEDSGEPDSTRGVARPIAADGALYDRNICPAGDEDWFSFNAVAGTTYTLETLNNGPEADTIITLLDSNGAVLAENDDHSPGVESQLVYAITQGGTYYAKVRLYNPTKYGSGTEYQFRLRPQTPDPTPTLPPVTPTPVPTLPPVTPTPQPSEVKTLILVNRSQIAEVAGEAATDAMLGKLGELASHAEVQGQILRLDQNDEVRAAYAEWNKAENQTNVLKANAVTAAIRQVILSQLAAKASIKFVVLVGDDRALPFRRIYDNTPYTAENTYPGIDATTPIGAALRANYFLSDDYYVARTPIPFNGRELYLPDVAIGRLVETPNDIMQSVNRFLAGNGVTPINGVLITGWDFVQDQAQADCDDWRRDFNASAVNCDLIGDSWSAAQLRSLQVSTNPLFNVQMIAGHANHTSEGTPNRGSVTAQEIASSTVDWNGGLIYTPACHAGLNLPFTQSANPLDLTQAFVGRGANYVANTGYGWGLRGAIGLSEKIMHFYTKALLQGGESQLGPALVTAKTRYYQSNTTLTGFDEKVLQQVILYGLPMQKLQSGSALSDDDDVEFPGVIITDAETLSGDDLTVSTRGMNFAGGTTWELHTTDNGNYYSLDGHTNGVPDEPLQAIHYSKLGNRDVRGAVIISGSFSITTNFISLLATADNEYVELPATNNGATGWQPATPLNLQVRSQDAYLVTQLGQYNGAERLLRRFNGLEVQLYASTSNDRQPPQLTVVDGVYLPTASEVAVKVGTDDASGIYEVVVAYRQGDRQGDGAIRSIKLSYDAQAQKWHGRFPGTEQSRFMVQVVDKAGNVAVANNKGADYQPAHSIFEPPATIARKLYLPMILR